MIKRSDIVVGAQVYTFIKDEPWTVTTIDDHEIVELTRKGRVKLLKAKSMLYNYTLVGSDLHNLTIKDYKRRGWSVWEGYK